MHLFHYKTTLTNKVYLVQTDTTVGFLSQNSKQLSLLKARPSDKAFVSVTSSFKTLKTLCRIPKAHAKKIRRSHKTSFVYANNRAVRVVKETAHSEFLKKFKWMYSSSANASGKSFAKEFASSKSDIIVEENAGLFEGEPSALYRINRHKLQRLR